MEITAENIKEKLSGFTLYLSVVHEEYDNHEKGIVTADEAINYLEKGLTVYAKNEVTRDCYSIRKNRRTSIIEVKVSD